LPDEFKLIRRYFDRGRKASGVVAGIGDDGAVLLPSPAYDQVQVIDTLVAGVHFPLDSDAADVAYRAVAVNLSDIAAMGARPRWMTLALTMPESSEKWLQRFASGLFDAADEYDVALVGGDTTKGENLVVTISMTGEVERNAALLRSGAQPGDTVFVSGTFGDAGAGLRLLLSGKGDGFLQRRFLRPSARVAIGRALVGRANAAIDVSDGLLGDLRKLIEASAVGADIDIDSVPISEELRTEFANEESESFALCAGDDYELCFTAAAVDVANIDGITAIGRVTDGDELVCRQDGKIVEIEHKGYRHFE
jgi:thiamine-monophosphate kinase